MARITQKDNTPQKIKAWSFSALSQYNECPRKTYFAKIARIAEPKAPALAKGIAIHEQLENCLKNASIPCPPELMKIETNLNELRSQGAIAELEMAFDKFWNPTGWFDANCWLRVKIDAIIPPKLDGDARVTVWDWKSGKVAEEHSKYDDQLELYQLCALIWYPTAMAANAGMIFVEHGVVIEADEDITRDMIPMLKAKWEDRAKPLLCDEEFSARPSAQACKWCFYSKAKNGDCEY